MQMGVRKQHIFPMMKSKQGEEDFQAQEKLLNFHNHLCRAIGGLLGCVKQQSRIAQVQDQDPEEFAKMSFCALVSFNHCQPVQMTWGMT